MWRKVPAPPSGRVAEGKDRWTLQTHNELEGNITQIKVREAPGHWALSPALRKQRKRLALNLPVTQLRTL